MQSNENKTFEIKQDKDIYIISISKSAQNSISIKAFNKENKSNISHSNDFSYDSLTSISKSFKICDSIDEIYDLISSNLSKNNIRILFSEKNIEICFIFTLPNEKKEEIKLPLLQVLETLPEKKIENSKIEEICQSLTLIEEKSNALEKEINNIKSEQQTLKNKIGGEEDEIVLFNFMSEKFKVSKYKLSKDLKKHLNDFGLNEEYSKQIHKKFQSKMKKIFDVKIDGDTLIGFMAKVFGKKNLVSFHSLCEEDDYLNVQLAYINGKFEFVNNYFNFQNTELYTYGDYENSMGEFCYTSFKEQNSKLYAKIEFDCIYIIFYEHGNIDFVAKIRDNYYNNPVLYINENLDEIEEFFKNNPEEKVVELFYQYEPKELNVTDLAVYQLEEE